MPKTITLYTLDELKSRYPKGYASVRERWIAKCDHSGDIPWCDEIVASLNALVYVMGFKPKNWEIGPYRASYIDVRGEYDMDFDDDRKYALQRLRAAGYVDGDNKVPTTDGRCKLTGVCYDDDFVEKFWEHIESGRPVSVALTSLASKASSLMEKECEAQKDEGLLEASWGRRLYARDGTYVPAVD